jgi:hypothetical protein
MALSETFPDFRPQIMPEIIPAARTTRSLIPITARELVEWTYAEQGAQGVRELSLEPQGRSQTGVVADILTEYAALGCKIDRSGNAVAMWGETKCHEDAITVHGAVRELPRRTQELLIENGRQRQAPDWNPKTFPFTCVPVRGNGGKPKGIYLNSGNKQVGSEIAYQGDWPSRDFAMEARIAGEAHKGLWADPSNWPAMRIRRRDRPMAADHNWSGEPFRRCADEVLARARSVYRQWYEGLRALCDGLEAAGPRGLARYRIAGLGAAYEPWRA